MPDRWLNLYASNQQVIDLTPYLERWEGTATLSDATLEMSRLLGDRPYFLPYGPYIRGIYYNLDMFKKAGIDKPPATIDEFVAAAKQLTEQLPGKYGWCLRAGRGAFVDWWMFMSAMAGKSSWFNEDGTSWFDSPEAISGMQMVVDLYQHGYAPRDSVNWGFNETTAGFYSETCGMAHADPDVVIPIVEHLGKDKFATVPVPVGPSGKGAPPVGIFGWSISSTSENPDLAWELLAHLSSFENNIEWAKFVGVIPIHEGADKDPFFSGPQFAGWFKMLRDPNFKLGFLPVHLEKLGYFFDTMAYQTGQEMLLGQRPVEEVAREWAQYMTEAQQEWLANQR
jgi:multiple sugar transport system substrate-binding protein